jgi:hypothetical protein
MINPAQIPDEVVEAAARALCKEQRMFWPDLNNDERNIIRGEARAAIAAGLAAWPNAKTLRDDGRRQTYIVPALILPFPQEARDE